MDEQRAVMRPMTHRNSGDSMSLERPELTLRPLVSSRAVDQSRNSGGAPSGWGFRKPKLRTRRRREPEAPPMPSIPEPASERCGTESRRGDTAAGHGPAQGSASQRGTSSSEQRDKRGGYVFADNFEAPESNAVHGLRGNMTPSLHNGSQDSLNIQPGSANSSTIRLIRPRGKTVEGNGQIRQSSAPISINRQRRNSVYGSNALDFGFDGANESRQIEADRAESRSGATATLAGASSGLAGYMPQAPMAFRNAQAQRADSVRKKPPVSSVRLTKRPQSRTVSPIAVSILVPPETLTCPVHCSDAKRLMKLMRILGGRMRGDVEYQTSGHGVWAQGTLFIDDRGMLMSEGGGFHQTIVQDLRACVVKPPSDDGSDEFVEIATTVGMRLRVRPAERRMLEHWLASLLYWQQTPPLGILGDKGIDQRSLSRRPSFNSSDKNTTVIKIGKIQLYDKTTTRTAPASMRKNTFNNSNRWNKASCILSENGEFKIMSENDTALLATIQLSQLSRSAIQPLDESVLERKHCISIFPQYTSTATSVSIIKPIYFSFESNLLFEVWFVLLRAFTMPEIYGSQFSSDAAKDDQSSHSNVDFDAHENLFRIDKTLTIRVTEAKIKSGALAISSASAKPTSSAGKEKEKSKPAAQTDPNKADYFVEVMLDSEVRLRTPIKKDTLRPFWREECSFSDLPSALPEVTVVLKKMVPPRIFGSTPKSKIPAEATIEVKVGTVQIRMDQLEKGKVLETWWPIMCASAPRDTIGEMLIMVRHDELPVLLSKEYSPITEMLLKFNTGLTVQISQVLAKPKFLSEMFLDLFQVSGNSERWLVALVEDEVDGVTKETPVQRLRFSRRVGSNDTGGQTTEREVTVRDMNKSLASEAILLFRGNSLLTQALDFHMRRVGSEYLIDVLGAKVRDINTELPNIEVDPARLGPDEDLKRNWSTLSTLTTAMWQQIMTSYSRCPPELRQVLKYIRAVAEDRYGDFLRTVPYTSVSGFLFLRFFCPALLNPKLFGLLRDHPHPKAQRCLTLIAKSLQSLANLSTFGQKEEWMEPMNRFLSLNRQSVKDFIDNICDIPTPQPGSSRAQPTINPSYSTPLAILKRLPEISKEGWLSLPYLIDDAKTHAALVRFWLDAISTLEKDGAEADLGPEGSDLRRFHELCLQLASRTEDCVRCAEGPDGAAAAAAAAAAGQGREKEGNRNEDAELEAEVEELLNTLNDVEARITIEAESSTPTLTPTISATASLTNISIKADSSYPHSQGINAQQLHEQVRMLTHSSSGASDKRWNSGGRNIPGSAGSGSMSMETISTSAGTAGGSMMTKSRSSFFNTLGKTASAERQGVEGVFEGKDGKGKVTAAGEEVWDLCADHDITNTPKKGEKESKGKSGFLAGLTGRKKDVAPW